MNEKLTRMYSGCVVVSEMTGKAHLSEDDREKSDGWSHEVFRAVRGKDGKAKRDAKRNPLTGESLGKTLRLSEAIQIAKANVDKGEPKQDEEEVEKILNTPVSQVTGEVKLDESKLEPAKKAGPAKAGAKVKK